ncbi:thiamine transporter 1 [Clarias gariepinus]|uniref:thiamine transporter 1 n=1 Tax=Clarias gariepinus TaxID=13013 RepID=UPI00234C6530|nr:thiamine transporter 1 [Clarias gariepinus]
MDLFRRWRTGWCFPTTLLCLYGFFSSVKPLEPFLISYMTGPDKNLTIEQVANQIFPVWTYSYLAMLLPVFLLTDWLRYKPVIMVQCLALFSTNVMLLWLESVGGMQAMQFTYSVVTACEVAYFSYIYSVVDLQYYLKATSFCRAAQLIGYTFGSVAGQILLSFKLMSYYYILVFTLVLISISFIISILLPMPRTSMFFHQNKRNDKGGDMNQVKDCNEKEKTVETEKGKTDCNDHSEEFMEDKQQDLEIAQEEILVGSGADAEKAGCCETIRQLWMDFLRCFSSKEMLIWSVWWAMATCGYNQTVNYVQALWETVEPSKNDTLFNGGVEAVSNLFGAASAYGVGFSRVNWSHWGELALGSLSALSSAALYIMVFISNIWICYGGYIIFKSLYMLLITIAMFRIAAGLSVERYALVFGVNTFVALVLQTILTSIVVDSRGLGLDIITQFIIYGSYFCLIALIFFTRGVYTLYLQRTKQRATDPDTHSDGEHAYTHSVKL